MKHFTSKAATAKHYCCNLCSIGGYKNAEKQIKSRPTTCTMAVELSSITSLTTFQSLSLQHVLTTFVTSVVKKTKLSSIYTDGTFFI
jgi:hypothetical protein